MTDEEQQNDQSIETIDTQNNEESTVEVSPEDNLENPETNNAAEDEPTQECNYEDDTCKNNDSNYKRDAIYDEPEQMRKVFVGGINYRTDEVVLKAHFAEHGDIIDCVIMRDPGGRSRGFAFVTYTKREMVDSVMKNRPHVVDGRDLDVKRATPKEDAGKPGIQLSVRKLFIGSVRDGITEEDLKEYFSKYGTVTDCVVMKDSEGKLRGFGFVTFDDHDPVDKVIIEKNHSINGQVLDVKKALPKRRPSTNAASPYGRSSGDGPSGNWFEPSPFDGFGGMFPSRGGSGSNRYYGNGGNFNGSGSYYGSPMRMRRGGAYNNDRSF